VESVIIAGLAIGNEAESSDDVDRCVRNFRLWRNRAGNGPGEE
jgi:hypothetical protein